MESDLVQSLKTSLASRSAQDYERFIRLAQPIIASAIIRVLTRWGQLTRDRADDLVQDTFGHLYKEDAHALRSFESHNEGSLAAWLQKVSASVAIDSLRSAKAQRHGSGQRHEDVSDPGLSIPSSANTFEIVEKSIFTERINRCLESQKERDRAIFWLYYRQGFTAKDISGLTAMGMGVKGVETTIYRVTRAVRDCMGNGGQLQPAPDGRRKPPTNSVYTGQERHAAE